MMISPNDEIWWNQYIGNLIYNGLKWCYPWDGTNALLIWTICRKNHCKLSLVVEEYRSKVQYSMINCSSGILSTVVKVQYPMMNCSNDISSTVVVSYEGYVLLQ